jgi:hypothetical protein
MNCQYDLGVPVAQVPGYRSRGLEVVGLEWGPLSLVRKMRSYLEEIVVAPVKKIEKTAVGIHRADHATPFYTQT